MRRSDFRSMCKIYGSSEIDQSLATSNLKVCYSCTYVMGYRELCTAMTVENRVCYSMACTLLG